MNSLQTKEQGQEALKALNDKLGLMHENTKHGFSPQTLDEYAVTILRSGMATEKRTPSQKKIELERWRTLVDASSRSTCFTFDYTTQKFGTKPALMVILPGFDGKPNFGGRWLSLEKEDINGECICVCHGKNIRQYMLTTPTPERKKLSKTSTMAQGEALAKAKSATKSRKNKRKLPPAPATVPSPTAEGIDCDFDYIMDVCSSQEGWNAFNDALRSHGPESKQAVQGSMDSLDYSIIHAKRPIEDTRVLDTAIEDSCASVLSGFLPTIDGFDSSIGHQHQVAIPERPSDKNGQMMQEFMKDPRHGLPEPLPI